MATEVQSVKLQPNEKPMVAPDGAIWLMLSRSVEAKE
jgi:hypothetical protein